MNDVFNNNDNKKRVFLLIAIFAGILGGLIVMVPNPLDYVWTPIVNNTNLAPTFPGISVGTGERVINTLYCANDTPRDIYIFAHVATGGSIDIDYTVNGYTLQDDDVKVSGSDTNRSKWFHVPYGACYEIEWDVAGTHHYNWTEYKYNWVKKP